MTKQELGTKRSCAHCGAKFYDLHHSPITCPKCGTTFEIAPVGSRFGSGPARAPMPMSELEMPETKEGQFVSFEGAEEKASGKPNAELEGEDDAEADEAGLNDAALIEEVEEDGAEVTGFIDDEDDD